jgi:hypothetical protein
MDSCSPIPLPLLLVFGVPRSIGPVGHLDGRVVMGHFALVRGIHPSGRSISGKVAGPKGLAPARSDSALRGSGVDRPPDDAPSLRAPVGNQGDHSFRVAGNTGDPTGAPR